MRKILFLIIGLAFSSCVYAEVIHVRVDGLYCKLCSGSLTKALEKERSINKATLFLKHGTIVLKPRKNALVNVGGFETLVNDSSYNFKGMSIKGTGVIKKKGSRLMFVANATNNSYPLAPIQGFTPNIRKQVTQSLNSGKQVKFAGDLVTKDGLYVVYVKEISVLGN